MSRGPAVRLVTWNVHACQAGVENVAEQLRTFDADVICLQEVESGTLESPEADQANRIARLLDLQVTATPIPERNSKHEQVAILTTGDINDAEYLDAGTGRHYGLTASIEWPDGRRLRIVCVHLTSNATSDVGRFFVSGFRRLEEVGDLADVPRPPADEPLVIAGDFNAGPGMLEHATLSWHYRWVPYLQRTFPVDSAWMQLDHVFLLGPVRADALRVESTQASDHAALVVDLLFLEDK